MIMKISVMVVAFLLCVAIGARAQLPDDVFWQPISPPGGQPDAGVRALVVYDGWLVVGGQFVNIGSLAVNHIARWDGASWSTLGTGCDGPVLDMTVYDGDLIAVGSFYSAGGTEVVGVAAWDGTDWSPLDVPIANTPHLLTVYDGRLFAGVNFTNQISGEVSSYVEEWSGSSWGVIGHFFDWSYPPYGYMWDLTADDDELAACGWFDVQGTGPKIGPVAAWDGSSWSGRGETYGQVFSLGHYNGQLVSGGWGGVSAWNGTSWSLLGADDQGLPIMVLGMHDGDLIACGQFGAMGGQTALGIAAFDGTSWSPLGSGVWQSAPSYPGDVYALCTYDNALVVGGDFAGAGGKSIPYLARWTKTPPVPVAITGFEAEGKEDGIRLSWSLADNMDVDGFRIYRDRVGEAAAVPLNGELLEPATRSYLDATALPDERYQYTLVVVTANSGEFRSQTITATRAHLAVRLYQNAPNPFNPTTSIRYVVPGSSHVVLRVYTPSGELVRTLVDATQPAGVHQVAWDGTDSGGVPVASGVYVCRLRVGIQAQSIKMTVLK
jgi:hypothetical protein